MTGHVVDESGVPLGNSRITVDYRNGSQNGAWTTVQADATGRYEVEFDTLTGQYPEDFWGLADIVGVVWVSHVDMDGIGQPVISKVAEIARNFRLKRFRPVSAGEATTVNIDTESSACADWDTYYGLNALCETVLISVPASGMLTVEARPRGAGPIAVVQTYRDPWVRAEGRISYPVTAGQVARLWIEIPRALAGQRYDILTSLQPSGTARRK